MPTEADKARATWKGWTSQASEWVPLAELLAEIRKDHGVDIDQAQIEQWTARGFLPPKAAYGQSDGELIWMVYQAVRAGRTPDEIRTLARITADRLNKADAIKTEEKLAARVDEEKRRQQTWLDWIPEGWPAPADEELIGREELLDRVEREFGIEIRPRTLQELEQQGLTPRPIRKWHEGATRALYAPWVVDLVGRGYLRRGRGNVEDAIEEVRAAVPQVIALYGHEVWEGKTIPMAFMDTLTEFAEVQERRLGVSIPFAEIRFLDEEGNPVMTLRQPIKPGRRLSRA